MEYVTMNGLKRDVSRIGLGTWSIGGFMWGGTDEHAAIETIIKALIGITLLDTAPVYGLGGAEEWSPRLLGDRGADLLFVRCHDITPTAPFDACNKRAPAPGTSSPCAATR